MKWLFEHFQIVVLIGFALVSLAKRRKDLAQAGEEERRAREEMAEDAEVLGTDRHPPPALPPPVARHLPQLVVKKAAAPLARAGQAAPVVAAADARILKQQQELMARLQQIRDTKATTTGGAAATRSRVSAAQRHPKAAPVATSGLRASLHSRKDIRRAVVLREILGPPVGLR
ncbi:MAG: hypothetical protein WCJ14_00620 [Verrucomicrobiota bacterium]